VTSLAASSRAVVRFYNKRGTAEQWIKEGKQAVAMTRLSGHRFRANEVRLWLSLIAYNLGNLCRRLARPTQVATWSLTSLQQRLVKTGGRLIKHARYCWLLLAESHLTRRLFAGMLRKIDGAAVAGGIARAQSGAKFDVGGGRSERCVRNRSKKMHFRAWLAHQMRNPAHPGAAGNTVNQSRLKPCRRRPFGLSGELQSESQSGNPGPIVLLSAHKSTSRPPISLSSSPTCDLRKASSPGRAPVSSIWRLPEKNLPRYSIVIHK
jgi:hypothetical protein